LDAGFWLSFIAVAVLILTFSNSSQQRHATTSFFNTQWVLLIGMLPLTLLVFSKVSLLTPIVNLIMIPLMTFIMIPLVFLMLLVMTVMQSIPGLLVVLLQAISQSFIGLLQWFEMMTLWPVNIPITAWWQLTLIVLGSLLLILPKAIPQRYWGLLLIVAAVFNPKVIQPSNEFKAYFLDVGQGLAVVIETQSHAMVYDVGAAYDSGFNMTDAVVLPFLAKHQIDSLDVLMLSHQDNDHAGSAPYLLDQIPIKQIWGTENYHIPCTTGSQWVWDGVVFSILSPLNLTPYLKNNSSCVLKIQAAHSSLLLTGDIESPVEYRLTKQQSSEIKSDVLLIPHHGSKTSSSASFIQAVNPQTAINSSGQFNPFNHPAIDILSIYEKLGIEVIDTQNSGLITMSTYPALTFKQFRHQSHKIWRKKKPE
jgi:competence protein ComEC